MLSSREQLLNNTGHNKKHDD